MKKLWVLILLISLGLNFGLGVRLLRDQAQLPSCPQDTDFKSGPGPDCAPVEKGPAGMAQLAGRRLERLAAHLNLTPEQKVVFARTRADVGSGMMVRRTEMQAARELLLQLVTDESTPPELLRRSFHKLAARQVEIDSVITEVLLQELDILDTEQRVQYLKMLPMNQRGHAGMRSRGRGLRGPG